MREGKEQVKEFLRSVDWQLLLFLLLFLDVKLFCKIIAIILIYVLRPDIRLGLRRVGSRLPLFYIGMILIALLDWLVYGLYGDRNYTIAMGCGILFWAMCLLAIHQVKLSVERSDPDVLHRTLLVFFAINAVVSFLMLARIMILAGDINPYTYQGEFQKYYLGTGDYIKGLSFDASGTNALINAFGVIYFLSRRRAAMTLVCMIVLLLTGSNAINLLLAVILVWMFIFRSDRDRKSLIVVSLFMILLFMVRISPQNMSYVYAKFNMMIRGSEFAGAKPVIDRRSILDIPDSLLTPDQRKEKIAEHYVDSVTYVVWRRKDSINRRLGIVIPVIRPRPKPDIYSALYQSRNDTTIQQVKLIAFAQDQGMATQIRDAGTGYERWPGKIIAMGQTAAWFRQHPGKLLTGNGMGRFSSKLAFRSAALGIQGGYPSSLRTIGRDFRDLHLALYLFFFTRNAGAHSMLNTPDNVVDQLLGEYGLAGLALFVFLYIGFFTRHRKRLSYGLPLLMIMASAFFTGYWFEQLSVVILFEFMMLLDIREGGEHDVR